MMQNLNLKSYLTLRNFVYLLLIAPVFYTIMLFLIDDSDEFSNVGTASYTHLAKQQSCSAGKLDGEKGATYGGRNNQIWALMALSCIFRFSRILKPLARPFNFFEAEH